MKSDASLPSSSPQVLALGRSWVFAGYYNIQHYEALGRTLKTPRTILMGGHGGKAGRGVFAREKEAFFGNS